jgi:acyl carrier protein
MDDVRSRLIKCFEAVFPDLPEGDIPKATQASLASWDSVAAITLLNVIDEEFGINLDFDLAADLDSFEKIEQHLASMVNA